MSAEQVVVLPYQDVSSSASGETRSGLSDEEVAVYVVRSTPAGGNSRRLNDNLFGFVGRSDEFENHKPSLRDPGFNGQRRTFETVSYTDGFDYILTDVQDASSETDLNDGWKGQMHVRKARSNVSKEKGGASTEKIEFVVSETRTKPFISIAEGSNGWRGGRSFLNPRKGNSGWKGIEKPTNVAAIDAKKSLLASKKKKKKGTKIALIGNSKSESKNQRNSTLKKTSRKNSSAADGVASTREKRSADPAAQVRMQYSEIYSPANDSYFYDTSRDGASARYVCESRVRHLEPAWGETVEGEVMQIVHSGDLPQHLAVEVCRFKSGGCGFLAAGVHSTCRQRYSIHRLASRDPSSPGEEIVQAAFKLPSGCFCYVKDDLRPKSEQSNNHRNPFDDPNFRGRSGSSRRLSLGSGEPSASFEHRDLTSSGSSMTRAFELPRSGKTNSDFKIDNEYMERHFPYIRLVDEPDPKIDAFRSPESGFDESDYILTLMKVLPNGKEVPVDVLINVDDTGKPSTSTLELLAKLNRAFELNAKNFNSDKMSKFKETSGTTRSNNFEYRSALHSRSEAISSMNYPQQRGSSGFVENNLGSYERQNYDPDSSESTSITILEDILSHLHSSKSSEKIEAESHPKPQALTTSGASRESKGTFFRDENDSFQPELDELMTGSPSNHESSYFMNHNVNSNKAVTTYVPRNRAMEISNLRAEQTIGNSYHGSRMVTKSTFRHIKDDGQNSRTGETDDLGGIFITKNDGNTMKEIKYLPFKSSRQRELPNFGHFPAKVDDMSFTSPPATTNGFYSEEVGKRLSKSLDARNSNGEIIRYIHPKEVFELLSNHSKQTLLRARKVVNLDDFVNVVASPSFQAYRNGDESFASPNSEHSRSNPGHVSVNENDGIPASLESLKESVQQLRDAKLQRQASGSKSFATPKTPPTYYDNDWIPMTRKSFRKKPEIKITPEKIRPPNAKEVLNVTDKSLVRGTSFDAEENERLKNHKIIKESNISKENIPKFFKDFFVDQKSDFWSAYTGENSPEIGSMKKEQHLRTGTNPPIDDSEETKKVLLHELQKIQGGNKNQNQVVLSSINIKNPKHPNDATQIVFKQIQHLPRDDKRIFKQVHQLGTHLTNQQKNLNNFSSFNRTQQQNLHEHRQEFSSLRNHEQPQKSQFERHQPPIQPQISNHHQPNHNLHFNQNHKLIQTPESVEAAQFNHNQWLQQNQSPVQHVQVVPHQPSDRLQSFKQQLNQQINQHIKPIQNQNSNKHVQPSVKQVVELPQIFKTLGTNTNLNDKEIGVAFVPYTTFVKENPQIQNFPNYKVLNSKIEGEFTTIRPTRSHFASTGLKAGNTRSQEENVILVIGDEKTNYKIDLSKISEEINQSREQMQKANVNHNQPAKSTFRYVPKEETSLESAPHSGVRVQGGNPPLGNELLRAQFNQPNQNHDARQKEFLVRPQSGLTSTSVLDNYVWNDQYSKSNNNPKNMLQGQPVNPTHTFAVEHMRNNGLKTHSIHLGSNENVQDLQRNQQINPMHQTHQPNSQQGSRVDNTFIRQLHPENVKSFTSGLGGSESQLGYRTNDGFSVVPSESNQVTTYTLHQNNSQTQVLNGDLSEVLEKEIFPESALQVETNPHEDQKDLLQISHFSTLGNLKHSQISTHKPYYSPEAHENQVQRPLLFNFDMPPPPVRSGKNFNPSPPGLIIKETAPYRLNLADMNKVQPERPHLPAHNKRPFVSWNPFNILG